LTSVVEDISYAEGLRWHEGALWFSDMGAGKVIRVVEGSPPQVVVDGLPSASGLGWTEDGALLVTSIEANTVFRVDDAGVPVPLVVPGSHGGGSARTTWSRSDHAVT
jgi:sugar lactone lactonase YvrE